PVQVGAPYHRRRMTPLRRVVVALATAALATALVALLASRGVLHSLELKGWDRLVTTAGLSPGSPEIVIVDIDDATMAAWGYLIVPRDKLAALIGRLQAADL